MVESNGNSEVDTGSNDTDADRYPTVDQVMAAMRRAEDYVEGPVERVEVNCLASGEATWRITAARADEPVGGYLPPGFGS